MKCIKPIGHDIARLDLISTEPSDLEASHISNHSLVPVRNSYNSLKRKAKLGHEPVSRMSTSKEKWKYYDEGDHLDQIRSDGDQQAKLYSPEGSDYSMLWDFSPNSTR